MTLSSREVAEHLLACYDTIYIVLGESAPTLTNDAYVVRTYEMGRAFGELALELREYLGDANIEPIPLIEGVLRRAVASDAATTGGQMGLVSRVMPLSLGR